jgi:hypothetical protein
VLLRPAALPTGQNDPLFERPDLTEDGYHRLRHPSRLTAARRKAVTPPNPDSHGYPGRTARRTSRRRRVTVRPSAAFRSRPLAGCAEQGNLHAARCALCTASPARNRQGGCGSMVLVTAGARLTGPGGAVVPCARRPGIGRSPRGRRGPRAGSAANPSLAKDSITSRHNEHREAGLPGKRDRHTERQSMITTHGDHNRPGRSALVGDR